MLKKTVLHSAQQGYAARLASDSTIHQSKVGGVGPGASARPHVMITVSVGHVHARCKMVTEELKHSCVVHGVLPYEDLVDDLIAAWDSIGRSITSGVTNSVRPLIARYPHPVKLAVTLDAALHEAQTQGRASAISSLNHFALDLTRKRREHSRQRFNWFLPAIGGALLTLVFSIAVARSSEIIAIIEAKFHIHFSWF